VHSVSSSTLYHFVADHSVSSCSLYHRALCIIFSVSSCTLYHQALCIILWQTMLALDHLVSPDGKVERSSTRMTPSVSSCSLYHRALCIIKHSVSFCGGPFCIIVLSVSSCVLYHQALCIIKHSVSFSLYHRGLCIIKHSVSSSTLYHFVADHVGARRRLRPLLTTSAALQCCNHSVHSAVGI
jgi:hypothetical protein